MDHVPDHNILAIADGSNLPGVYPPGVRWDIDIPEAATTLQMVEKAIRTYPDKIAMSFMGRTVTYREFGEWIDRAAASLKANGAAKGVKVGIFMPNTPYYPVFFYAAQRTGATVVNYSLAHKSKAPLKEQIEGSDTSVMVTLDLKDFITPVNELLQEGVLKRVVRCPFVDMLPDKKAKPFKILNSLPQPALSALLMVMGWVPSLKHKAEDFKRLKEKLAGAFPDTRALMLNFSVKSSDTISPISFVRPEAQDIAVLQYTSGSSGGPKGAVLTHFNLAANSMQVAEFFKAPSVKCPGETLLEPGQERAIAAIPLSHIFGETVLMSAYMAGGCELILQADPRNVGETLELIGERQATAYPAAPRLLTMITEDPHRQHYDISGLKTVIAGSEKLPGSTRHNLPEIEISEGYGQTEASPVISCNLQGAFNRPGSVGLPLPRTEVKIVSRDEPGKIMNVGEEGEIWVRGPQVMRGYYKNETATAKAMTEDGWLRTGDVGYLDQDCFLYICGRLGRAYKRNGLWVEPEQIEDKINSHPSVLESVVVTLNNLQGEKFGKALVRLKPGAAMGEDDNKAVLAQYLREKGLGSHEIPRMIEFVSEPLLRTAVNKIDWNNIQKAEQAKSIDKAPQPAPSL
ncbi:MAG: AMP-binding protein [Micavibrio aeruginosavorus]|uniref:Long-chain-fatty-acid--CoA ligase n=1 Tax=Micavibrio aeruginosavorus TaxID=349221 RepID=A0A7T5UGW7_9BACT|nr:MAG: AMP-binding protein [Micavibrio aeruginosavorus]